MPDRMRRWRKSAIAATALVALLGIVLGPVGNEAAAHTPWPGPLEQLRQNPWLTFLVGAALIIGLTILVTWHQVRTSGSDSAPQSASGGVVGSAQWELAQGATVLGVHGNIYGDLYIGTESDMIGAKSIAQRPDVVGTSTVAWRVLFAKRGQMDPKWRDALVDTLTQFQDQNILAAGQAYENELARPDVALLIVIFGAAKFRLVKSELLSTIHECRKNSPKAEVYVLACDLSQPPLQRATIERALREAQISENYEIEIFSDLNTDKFAEWLRRQIPVLDKIVRLERRGTGETKEGGSE